MQPGIERRHTVVVEQAELVELVENFSGAAMMADSGCQFGVADLVLATMSGQQHDQALVDPGGQSARPAMDLAEDAGGVTISGGVP